MLAGAVYWMGKHLDRGWNRKGRIAVFILKAAGGAFLALALLSAGAEWYIASASGGRVFEHSADVPVRAPALVLGCSPAFMGGPNGYFYNRMDTAAELWGPGRRRFLSFPGTIAPTPTMNRNG